MRRVLLATAAVLAMAVPVTASAETAADFNLFVLKDMTYRGSDTEGRVAVGGNASLTGYSVGALVPSSGTNLVVGGNLFGTNGNVNGKIAVGGSLVAPTATDNSFSHGTITTGAALPVNFATEAARLVTLSDYLNTFANTGSANIGGGANCGNGTNACQITFNANNAGLNVFDIDGALLSDTNTIDLNFGSNATVLINVSGSNIRLDGGMFVNGVNGGGDATKILWNFYDATSFAVGGMDLRGSALAPTAVYSGGGGVINGQLIVESFTGDMWNWQVGGTQVNNVKFAGNLLTLNPQAVPEPATWALMIGGFGMAGAMLRRRRRVLGL